jgi:uncharacterized protein
VTHFGAFVDIGVHQDGLVHRSQLADRYVEDPREVVKVGDIVDVTVLEVDIPRKRISLSMRKPKEKEAGTQPKKKAQVTKSSTDSLLATALHEALRKK